MLPPLIARWTAPSTPLFFMPPLVLVSICTGPWSHASSPDSATIRSPGVRPTWSTGVVPPLTSYCTAASLLGRAIVPRRPARVKQVLACPRRTCPAPDPGPVRNRHRIAPPMTTAAQKHVTDARDALDRRDHPQCLLLVRAGFAASPSNEDLEELLAVTRELSQGRSSVAAQARPLVAGLEGALRSRRQVPPTPPQPEYLDELIAAVRGYLDDGRETLAVTLLDDEIAEAAARRDADHLSALRQRLGGLANPPEAIASRTARVDDEVERIRWAEKRAGSTGGAPTAEST